MEEGACAAVLDIGTSAIKCGSVGVGGGLMCLDLEAFELDGDGTLCESDFDRCADAALAVLGRVMAATREAGAHVEAVLLTSQAQTFAPVDAEFRPLCRGIVWLDSRADAEAADLARELPDFSRFAGFCRPLPALYVAKLLWLKRHRAELYGRAACFPLVDEFIAQRLTGRFYSDFGNFGMGGVLDIRTKRLHPRVLELLGLSPAHFPELADPLGLGYPLRPDVGAALGCGAEVRVYFCGNDQSASAVGAGLSRPGDVSLNFGTAMVAYTLIDSLPDRILPEEIAGISPMEDHYFLLSYEEDLGTLIDQTKAEHFPHVSYDEFLRNYQAVGEAASVIERCLDRLDRHLIHIGRLVKPEKLYVSGGLAQSAAWLAILRERLSQEIVCSSRREAAIVGAARIYEARMNKPGD